MCLTTPTPYFRRFQAPLPLIGVVVAALFLGGCESFPPGTPPEDAIMEVKDVTILNKEFSDKRIALDYMITSVSTICPQIAMGGSPPPVVEHKFYFTNPMVDDMPQKLWNSLLHMKVVRPCQQGGTKPDFQLLSMLKETKEPAVDASLLADEDAATHKKEEIITPKTFKWSVTVKTGDGERKLWSDEIVIMLNPTGETPTGRPDQSKDDGKAKK